MHPVVYMGALVTLVSLASWHLWETDRFAFLDRVMLAAAVAMLLWVVALAGGQHPLIDAKEPFTVTATAQAAQQPAKDDDGIESTTLKSKIKLYESAFVESPLKDGKWGVFTFFPTANAVGSVSDFDVQARGIGVHRRRLQGPAVDSFKIGSDAFTWAIALRFNGFEGVEGPKPVIDMLTSTKEHDYIFKLSVEPTLKLSGTEIWKGKFSLAASKPDSKRQETFVSTKELTFDPERAYMLTVKRAGDTITVRRHHLTPSSARDKNSFDAPETLLSQSGLVAGLVPSNLPVNINESGELDAGVYAVALFDAGLSPESEEELRKHWASLVAEAVDPAERLPGDCPFGNDLCANAYCSSITDWSRPEQLIDSRVECKHAIAKFCTDNAEHPSCYCWKKTDARYEKSECKAWRSFIAGEQCSRLESLGAEDIERLKKLYNLESKNCTKKEEPAKPATPSPSPPPAAAGTCPAKPSGITNPYAGHPTSPATPTTTGVANPYATQPSDKTTGINNPYAALPNPIASEKKGSTGIANPYSLPAQPHAPSDDGKPPGTGSGVKNPYSSTPLNSVSTGVSNPYGGGGGAPPTKPGVDNPYGGGGATPAAPATPAPAPPTSPSPANPYLRPGPYTSPPSITTQRLVEIKRPEYSDRWKPSTAEKVAGDLKPQGLWGRIRDFVAGD